ncbi:SDR family oxidoreductase [Staphylococcus agnetis]|uniref:NAD(P)-binding oxidoreductase n=1 Tax=Staphylococcus agnetis TaxID=985762 RepID=UPI000D1BA631|nr:NAD(P)-binding oxidoreductase [Staphylococcus agnetis]MCO4338002.1 SDR family oxidoreductase [Staphylococcus agnetis]MCO4340293.1 SDR family oxidoreductase [Staphylococcus agnetis]MCO4343131.1 SDR family oxidoreductase [Staphylococcus agnetis]MCO4345075.1 SDR family oxidoreductase [Staphylococcus agnetis]MCO4347257.1 SDR family oxidoreductase [Staphylococcus agnetis]
MAKTFVLGANGGVGRHLVQLLKENHQDFTAGVRQASQKEALEEKGIEATQIDVEHDSIETLQSKLEGYDQVVFSVGSGGKTGADKTIAVDLDGAVKVIKACEDANISHFVMVSTWDSRREAIDAGGDLKPYTIAKHYADDYLRRSHLTATIVHPGGLTDEEGSGRVRIETLFNNPGARKIARENVAHVLYEVLTHPNHHGKEFQVLDGDQSIAEALNKTND